jgi:hypothetical protein
VLLGDANGIDKAVQKYFYNNGYKNVTVYATKGITRNNIGNWNVKSVDLNQHKKDFYYYTAKNLVMAKQCDYKLRYCK